VWRYDLETQVWEAIQISGKSPSPRLGSACASIGDRLYLFGGQGDNEVFGDLYIYDHLSSEWIEVAAAGLPSARKHACMTSSYPYLYLFGGITLNGYSDEVWRISIKNFESELLSSNNPTGPQLSAFSGCQIEPETLELFVFVGESTGETPLEEVFHFSVIDRTWANLGALTPRSQTAAVKVQDRILVVAGEAWGVEAHNTIHLMIKDEVVTLGKLSPAIYAGGSQYYKTSLYIFGGGDMFGKKLRPTVPVHNLYKLELNTDCGDYCNWPCSPGTYLTPQGDCQICLEGHYSDGFGLTSCKACPPGTHSSSLGNSSLRQCYPCKEGSYNSVAGSRYCLGCPSGFYCDIGSITPSTQAVYYSSSSSTVQPDLFKPGTSKVDSLSYKLQNVFIGLGCLTALLILVFKKQIYSMVASLDQYDSEHNYKEDVPLIKHKNFFGGTFTLLFYVCVLYYLIIAFLVYVYDNIEEIKALVPLVTLEKEYDNVRPKINADIDIVAEFGSYGASCVENVDTCNSKISVVISEVYADSIETICELVEQACVVTVRCKGCISMQAANWTTNSTRTGATLATSIQS
jgi:hypothetical protein